MKLKLFISLFLAFIVISFISQNTETVRVDFLIWSTMMSVVVLVFIALGIGILIGWLLNSYLRFVSKRKQQKITAVAQERTVARQDAAGVARSGNRDAHE